MNNYSTHHFSAKDGSYVQVMDLFMVNKSHPLQRVQAEALWQEVQVTELCIK